MREKNFGPAESWAGGPFLFFLISSIATQYPLSEYLSPMVKCPRNMVDSETIFRIFYSVGMSGAGDGNSPKPSNYHFVVALAEVRERGGGSKVFHLEELPLARRGISISHCRRRRKIDRS